MISKEILIVFIMYKADTILTAEEILISKRVLLKTIEESAILITCN